MSNVWLTVIVGLCTIAIGLLTFSDEIKKLRNAHKRSIIRLIVFIVASAGIILASIKKDNNSDTALHTEQLKRDSITTHKADSSTNVIIEALAQYGYKYDSAQKIIERLVQDSIRRTNININHGPAPTFSICRVDLIILKRKNKDSIEIKLPFCYKNAPAKVKLDIEIMAEDPINWYGFVERRKDVLTGNDIDIETDGGVDCTFDTRDIYKAKIFYLRLICSYFNHSLSKEYKSDYIYKYDFNTGKATYVAGKKDKQVREVFAMNSPPK